MKTAFIYSDKFEQFSYSPAHPLKPVRFKLTYELARAYGLFRSSLTKFVKAAPCAVDDLVMVHSIDYIEAVEHADRGVPEWERDYYGLGTRDNPLTPHVFDWSLLAVGATLQAAKLVAAGQVELAFNMAGGQHHATRNRAAGFCFFNDAAVAIQYLVDHGLRVAYVDLDAHHGDGVQEIFYRTDQVLTISLHESGQYAFPGTGYEREAGQAEGEGYAVNIPMLPQSDDDVFWYAFHEVVPEFLEKFRPDVLVTQLGVDTFRSDPLAALNVTTNGFCRVIEELKRLSPGKWVAIGGGGYDVLNVPRAWTLAWALMNDMDVPDVLPRAYLKLLHKLHLTDAVNENPPKRLRDKPFQVDLNTKIRLLMELEKTIAYLKNRQLKMIHA